MCSRCMQADGSVKVPAALQKYMGGRQVIEPATKGAALGKKKAIAAAN